MRRYEIEIKINKIFEGLKNAKWYVLLCWFFKNMIQKYNMITKKYNFVCYNFYQNKHNLFLILKS